MWRYIAKINVYEKEIGKSQLQQRIFKQMYRRAVSSGVAARQLRLGFVVARSANIRNVKTIHSTPTPTHYNSHISPAFDLDFDFDSSLFPYAPLRVRKYFQIKVR